MMDSVDKKMEMTNNTCAFEYVLKDNYSHSNWWLHDTPSSAGFACAYLNGTAGDYGAGRAYSDRIPVHIDLLDELIKRESRYDRKGV